MCRGCLRAFVQGVLLACVERLARDIASAYAIVFILAVVLDACFISRGSVGSRFDFSIFFIFAFCSRCGKIGVRVGTTFFVVGVRFRGCFCVFVSHLSK